MINLYNIVNNKTPLLKPPRRAEFTKRSFNQLPFYIYLSRLDILCLYLKLQIAKQKAVLGQKDGIGNKSADTIYKACLLARRKGYVINNPRR